MAKLLYGTIGYALLYADIAHAWKRVRSGRTLLQQSAGGAGGMDQSTL